MPEIEAANSEVTEHQRQDILKSILGNNYDDFLSKNQEEELTQLLKQFHKKGTILDILHMQITKTAIQLWISSKNHKQASEEEGTSTANIVVIASKMIQEVGDFMRKLDTAADSNKESTKQNPTTPKVAQRTSFSSGAVSGPRVSISNGSPSPASGPRMSFSGGNDLTRPTTGRLSVSSGTSNSQPSSRASFSASTNPYTPTPTNTNNNLVTKVQDLQKELKQSHLNQLIVLTKLALGAWPPADIVQQIVHCAVGLVVFCAKVTAAGNELGHFSIEDISLDQYSLSKSEEVDSKKENERKGSLSYSDYKKQAETKILDQIIASKPNTPISPSYKQDIVPFNQRKQSEAYKQDLKEISEMKIDDSSFDQPFFTSLDNYIRIFVQSIQKLKQSHAQQQKTEFVSAASAIYAACDALLEEVRGYYLWSEIQSGFFPDNSGISFVKQMQLFTEDILKSAEDIILKAKLASGVWPPPDSANEMMKATLPCASHVRKMVAYVKVACQVLRQTENEERSKKEAYMKQWDQNSQVRTLFDQYSKLLHTQTALQNNANSLGLTEEEMKMLEDVKEGLMFDQKEGKEIVKAGRLLKLVEQLATHGYPDHDYRDVFLLTYQTFTSPNDFMDLLLKRYDIFPPYGLDQRTFEVFINKKIVPIRSRVLNTIKFWHGKFPEDFKQNPQMLEKCLKFIDTKMRSDFGEIATQLAQTLKQNTLSMPARMSSPASPLMDLPPKPILPKGLQMEDLDLKKDPRAFLELDPLEWARQITLMESSVYKLIQPRECLGQAWEKSEKLTKSPHISQMIQNTNHMTMWVANSIVNCLDIKQRTNLIKFYIQTAQHLRDIHNFNAVTALVAGLSMGPVFRMTKTWKWMREKHTKVMDQFEILSNLVSAKGQYSAYRAMLRESSMPIIPFLGVYLTDLTFVDLGNPDYIPENNFINFDKRRKTAQIIQDIQKYQQSNFNYIPVQPMRDFLESLKEQQWPDEKTLYEKSWASEPKEEEPEDSASNLELNK